MGRILKGFWDCKYCGTKHIGGDKYTCPYCGHNRDADVKFYMSEDSEFVPPEKVNDMDLGPDWICEYCGALNHHGDLECHCCKSPRYDHKRDYFDAHPEVERVSEYDTEVKDQYADFMEGKADSPFEEDENEHEDDLENENTPSAEEEDGTSVTPYAMQSADDAHPEKDEEEKHKIFKKPNINFENINYRAIFGVTAAILLIALLCFLLIPREYNVTIDSFSWNRGIDVEEYVTVDEDGWSMPTGGRLHNKEWEIRTYEDVLDHYETKTRQYTEQVLDHYETVVTGHRDLGNGYFEEITSERPVYRTETRTETYQDPVYRKEPVYDWHYYYEIDKWVYAYTSKSNGNDQNPYWNEPDLKDNQRDSGRYEMYKINVTREDGKQKTYSFDYDIWKDLKKDSNITIKASIIGNAKLIKDGKEIIPIEN